MDPDRRAHNEEMEALDRWMKERSSDTMKAAEAMEPAELAEDVAFLQDVRHKLGLVERDLTIALGQKMGKGTGNLADGRQFAVSRAADRKEWDHEDWKRDARRKIAHGMADADDVAVDAASGETTPLREVIIRAITEAQAIHGATAPKSTALKALGLYASDYCTSTPSGWRFNALKPTDTDTTKDA